LDTKRLFSDAYAAYAAYHEKGMFRLDLREPQLELVKHYLASLDIADNARVVEVGCGLGHLNVSHPNWQGFEYSDSAIALAKKIYGPQLNIVEADGRDLPVESNSVDFLFSFDALEHIPEVERAFDEIMRTIKPNASGYLHPAWNCRSWQVDKLEVRPYSELSPSAKIGKFLIPLRDNVLFRLVCNLPGRIVRELRLMLGDKAIPLDYRPLEPDIALWERYDRNADDDAFISMDAHAALTYFVSRGWTTPSHPTFWKRFSVRSGGILVRKPA
jgi:SAM-dependent methyltransferase